MLLCLFKTERAKHHMRTTLYVGEDHVRTREFLRVKLKKQEDKPISVNLKLDTTLFQFY